MRMIQLTDQNNTSAIEDILVKCHITDYKIQLNGTVDVNGHVRLPDLKYIPVKFGTVTGYFICESPSLISLVGAPTHVGGDFLCYHTSITSLVGAPAHVGKDFYCSNTKITSLAGAPSHVGGDFSCSSTKITSLAGAPSYVGGDFGCNFNPIISLQGAPVYIGGHVGLQTTPNLRAILPIMKVNGIRGVSHLTGEIIMRHYKPDGTGDIIALQDDLIEAGFGDVARLK